MEPIHKPDVTQAPKPIQYINSCNCNMGFLLNFYKVFLDLLHYLQEVMFLEKIKSLTLFPEKTIFD
jgi:hypothetical protein